MNHALVCCVTTFIELLAAIVLFACFQFFSSPGICLQFIIATQVISVAQRDGYKYLPGKNLIFLKFWIIGIHEYYTNWEYGSHANFPVTR